MENPALAGALGAADIPGGADAESQALLEKLKEGVTSERESIGTLREKLTVTVPADVISQYVEHNFSELESDAQVPGFRKGHAPRALIEKRYGQEVRSSLKSMIIGQSYYAAIDKQEVEVLGDPMFCVTEEHGDKLMDIGEALQHLSLPESGDFQFACELEIKPSFELPSLEGIPIKVREVEITDEQVDEHIEHQKKNRGRFEPVNDGAAQADDGIRADVTLFVGDENVKHEDGVEFAVRGTRLDGITLNDLGDKLTGAKVEDSVEVPCQIPDDYERSDLRGKEGKFVFAIREIRRLKPATIEQLVAQTGAEDEAELRTFVKDDLEAEKDELGERVKRRQIHDFLLEKIPMDLPENLSARQTDRAVVRQVIELRQRGIPDSDIEARIDELRVSAKESVARDLKLAFILEKVAEQLGVHVTDEEVNTEIARMARLYDRRFDRVRDELQAQGLLSQLAEQIKHDKCIAQLLRDAEIKEIKAGDDSDEKKD
jgi:trigger factor